jgi:holo-[acyl-carrier protein] synthase
MIVGIGIDIQPVASIAQSIQRQTFIDKVFTPAEVQLCQRQPRRSAEHFAGKYAAKEAYMKAIGAGIRQGVWFTQIEILNRASGAPYVVTHRKAKSLTEELGVQTTHITISHTSDVAVGLIILEK